MQKITPFLWFDKNAEAAAKFYTSVFKPSKITDIARYSDAGPGPKGSVMTIRVRLLGQDFVLLNGGPHYQITPAVSFVVNCANQREIDYYWRKLTSGGGRPIQCGWLQDKFGVSWQIVPAELPKLITGKDPSRGARVMKALMEMVKLDLVDLRRAAAGAAKGKRTKR
jgi:predicted 3-demethylubiquinone-9 3-methyltransferase (glyoxalase superfamily)